MKNLYTTARLIDIETLTLDGDSMTSETHRAIAIECSSLNPAYPVARSCDRATWRKMYAVLRKFDSDLRDVDASTIGNRVALRNAIERASNRLGYVGVYWSGTDCDGASWSRSYAMPSHCVREIEKQLDDDASWLDGPAGYCLAMPTLRDVVYCTQERGLRLPYRISTHDFASD